VFVRELKLYGPKPNGHYELRTYYEHGTKRIRQFANNMFMFFANYNIVPKYGCML